MRTMLENFSCNLRKYRVFITQEELSSKIGVTEKQISRWENGNVAPNLKYFIAICNELGKTPNEMLGCKDEYLEKSGLSIDSINTLIEDNHNIDSLLADYTLSDALNYLLSSSRGKQVIRDVYELCKKS